MDRLFGDLRSGVRMLVRYPTLSLVAVLTLGLGIGLEHDRLLRRQRRAVQGPAVPERRSHRLGLLTNAAQNQPRQPISVHDLAVLAGATDLVREDRRLQCRPVQPVDRSGPAGAVSGRPAHARRVRALGVQPLLGRGFREGDDRPGAERRAARPRPVARSIRQRCRTSSGRRSAPTACS